MTVRHLAASTLEAVGLVRPPAPESLPDQALVQRARFGDDVAFRELVHRHQGRIRGLLLRLCRGDAALCDDLAQEVFLRVHRGLVGFEGRARFSTWVYRIAYNVYLNHRERTRELVELPRGYDAATPGTGSRDHAGRSDLRRDLQQALDNLPERYRRVLILHYLRDVSYPEIAELLDIPLGTVKTHLHRAKRLLRAQMHGWPGVEAQADAGLVEAGGA